MVRQKHIDKKKLQSQYKQLVSEYIIKATPAMDQAAQNAHKLYNAALYQVRQHFFKYSSKKKKYLTYNKLDTIFKTKRNNKENMLYASFPYVQSAQQTLREVITNWKAWFSASKAYQVNPAKFTGKPKMPKYLRKNTSRHIFYVTNQNAKIKDGYLVIKKLNLKLKLANDQIAKIGTITFKPVYKGYKVIVPYKLNKNIDYKPDNGKYIGIDPGVDNAFTCVSNTGVQPLIINGKPLKSVNQYYNKRRAYLKSKQAHCHQLETIIYTKQGLKSIYAETKQLKRLTNWRNTKIKEFAHKASKRIINYALSCGANTIIIGKSSLWKQNANLSKKNNQNFIGIPHAVMIQMVKYKANLAGITVITTNESYTSQTSALDHEKPCWNNGNKSRQLQGKSPVKRRIKRGLFKTNQGLLINADVNGALQIIKKVFPNISFDQGIVDAVLHPVKWTPLI